MNTNLSGSFKRGLRNAMLGVIAFVAFASICEAQTKSPDLPDGNGAWILQVATRGGLDGQGKGDFWITSKRELTCSRKEMSCPKEVANQTADGLAQMIAAVTPAIWSNPVPDNLCPDCLVIMMKITIRGHDGSIQNLAANWDITTQSRLPAEILRLYKAAAAVAK